ncbi:phospholipase [Paractinoplanes atraurantiacus]|uniref:Phospholipase A2 n=1 Tax=Paractinoplanes atraurantiacus TaxID=1036182 RepID=A0A285F276_9ACTN|nr:phospholipase [Actinoplanes atraurantiacus]SNY05409.1 phospholipase A2 [Actinoplanes atraurantiacus]
MTRRIVVVLALVVAVLIPSLPASATVDRLSVLDSWTQPTAASTAAWNSARLDKEKWAAYGFDWTTDYCSASPERPLGFDFTNACVHHDFGYRNYKDEGLFDQNKARIDDTFHADMRRVCAEYRSVARSACYSVAWIYYQAVHVFGSVAKVRGADLDRASRIMR